jgi:glycosyltransferase involved in cell wall biosynthesis
LRAVRAASELPGPALVLGYNTAVLNEILRRRSKAFVVNMDGIEWRRRKWGAVAKTWFYLNEAIATRRSTHLIADHPDIQRHLERHRRSAPVTMIPYGADKVTAGDEHLLDRWALRPGRYATVIARPEPENSILEMVTAFSRRRRDRKLVVLGAYDVSNAYQHEVMSAASDEVLFPGPIYETELVEALRFHSAFYAYGHSVGGTSPTLVEALAAGSPPLCLDTVYSRWVAGSAGEYFRTIEECDQLMTALFEEEETSRSVRRERAYARHQEEFTWERILAGYQQLLQGLAE